MDIILKSAKDNGIDLTGGKITIGLLEVLGMTLLMETARMTQRFIAGLKATTVLQT